MLALIDNNMQPLNAEDTVWEIWEECQDRAYRSTPGPCMMSKV